MKNCDYCLRKTKGARTLFFNEKINYVEIGKIFRYCYHIKKSMSLVNPKREGK